MITLQQQAYDLIDELPDDSVKIIIELMSRMPKIEKINTAVKTPINETGKERKRAAFERMKELRKAAIQHPIEDVEAARDEAVREKHGVI